VTEHEQGVWVSRPYDDEFDAFMTASWSSLFRAAMLMTGDFHAAEDLLQASMAKVYRAWPRVSRVDHPRAYARTVMTNEAISWSRRRSSSERPVDHWPDQATPGHEDRVAETEQVRRLLQLLSPRQRAVVVLRYYEDMSEVEIAAALGMSQGSVKSHAHHALRMLERLVTAEGDADHDVDVETKGGQP
jgi:RNA polymerase sigma-70 factor (sigma-E family)